MVAHRSCVDEEGKEDRINVVAQATGTLRNGNTVRAVYCISLRNLQKTICKPHRQSSLLLFLFQNFSARGEQIRIRIVPTRMLRSLVTGLLYKIFAPGAAQKDSRLNVELRKVRRTRARALPIL